MAEGNIWEAVALAAHYRLGNLIGIVDVNRLGQTEATMYGHDVDSYARRFGAFGWHTQGIDGHNMEEVLAAYQAAIDCTDGPSMITAKTVKGKGVSFLEDHNGRHGKPVTGEEFDRALKEIGDPRLEESLSVAIPTISDGDPARATPAVGEIDPPRYEKGEQVPTRKVYAAGLTKLGKVDPRVIALDAELKNSTYTEDFLKEIPDRFIECYIAEQNIIGMAHGLSVRGKIPFCSTFASFLSRAYDQIRMASISGANIKYAGSHAGVSTGEDGPSQMGLEDLAMFRAVHDSTILYPADAVATERMVALAAQHAGMIYLRLTRPKTPILYSAADTFAIGGSHTLRSSADDEVAIIAAGITVYEALTAARLLEKDRITARVIDAYSLKPLDAKTVHQAAEETGAVLTVEDHYPEGGHGDAVLNVLAGCSVSTRKLAVYNMPRSGDPETLMNHYGIGVSSIVAAVKEMLGGA
jgi:transketolase